MSSQIALVTFLKTPAFGKTGLVGDDNCVRCEHSSKLEFPVPSLNIKHIVARMWRLYETGVGLTTGFIGSLSVTSVTVYYTLQLTTTESLLFL
jgi:hypothetical protein